MFDTIQKWITSWQTGDNQHQQDPEHALQLAAAVLLIEISRSDAHVSSTEEAVILRAIKATFELTEEEADSVIATANRETDEAVSFYEFTRVINDQFSAEQKSELVKMLWEVAVADGHIDDYEDHYIRKIADLIYVPHSEFIRTKLLVLGTE